MIYKFHPIFKTTIWGGEKIAPFKHISTDQNCIGESWEISGVRGSESIVDGGPDNGKTLSELIKERGSALVGKKVAAAYGEEFPLLIKFIDACQDLSVQVHPDDKLAASRHNGSRGKTEMWYVVDAAPDAKLLSGFSRPVSKEDYEKAVQEDRVEEILSESEVYPGDVFFLPAGRVHAIGAGCFVAEIQETSDITYRIYDYGRKDSDGKSRELHTELAKDAIDYSVEEDYRTHYKPETDRPVNLVECAHFSTTLHDITKPTDIPVASNDSFLILMCLEGDASIKDSDSEVTVKRGQSILIPATEEKVTVTPHPKAKLLTTFIPS